MKWKTVVLFISTVLIRLLRKTHRYVIHAFRPHPPHPPPPPPPPSATNFCRMCRHPNSKGRKGANARTIAERNANHGAVSRTPLIYRLARDNSCTFLVLLREMPVIAFSFSIWVFRSADWWRRKRNPSVSLFASRRSQPVAISEVCTIST